MKTITQQLVNYASYHRSRRNIVTHFIGIPMIVLAITILLSRPSMVLAGMSVSAALVVTVVATLYYLRLDPRLGLAMAALLTLSLWIGHQFALKPLMVWLGAGVGLFVVGWIFQFIGHYYEGRKPAFVDDLMGLVIGPLFVAAEAAFMLGLRSELRRAIEAEAGPLRA